MYIFFCLKSMFTMKNLGEGVNFSGKIANEDLCSVPKRFPEKKCIFLESNIFQTTLYGLKSLQKHYDDL